MVVPVASENVSASQLQHYVPRFLLRRFADVQNGRVHVFDKHTDAAFIANPNKVAAKNGLYSFKFIGHDMTLEPALAELEGRAAPHVARILQDRRLHPEDALERVELARFFAVQLVRTPAHRETWRDLWTRMETWLREQGMPDDYFQPDPKIGSGEHAERALAARMISTAPQTMAPALMDKDWLLLATDAGHPFLLGDHPLAMHNDVDRGLRGNLGLNVEGIEPLLSAVTAASIGDGLPVTPRRVGQRDRKTRSTGRGPIADRRRVQGDVVLRVGHCGGNASWAAATIESCKCRVLQLTSDFHG